jgi:flagella basal body P-ring formation protein FlgA
VINELLAASGFATTVFTGLSPQPEVAAQQKSAIAQALRAAFPSPSAFVEEDGRFDLAAEPNQHHHRVLLQCLQCPSITEMMSIDPGSVKFSSTPEKHHAFQLTFSHRVSEAEESSTAWRVSATVEPLRFVIVTRETLPKGTLVDGSHLEIAPCIGRRKCSTQAEHKTYEEVANELVALSGLVSRRHLTGADVVESKDFLRPARVKKGAEVRIAVTTPGGLTLSTKATALEQGAVGDKIHVRLHRETWEQPNRAASLVVGQILDDGTVHYEVD